jgi:hypothetical protein
MPAICNTCGTAFPSGFAFENCRSVSLQGNQAGPCPKCGGRGDIPNGIFSFIDNTIEVISANYKTVETLRNIYNVVEDIKNENLSSEKMTEKIIKNIPELNSFTQNELNRENISLLLAAIALLLQFYQAFHSDNKTDINTINNVTIERNISKDEIEKITNDAIQEVMDINNQKEITTKPTINKKLQKRNELCNCGSGLKYKKCCLNQYI